MLADKKNIYFTSQTSTETRHPNRREKEEENPLYCTCYFYSSSKCTREKQYRVLYIHKHQSFKLMSPNPPVVLDCLMRSLVVESNVIHVREHAARRCFHSYACHLSCLTSPYACCFLLVWRENSGTSCSQMLNLELTLGSMGKPGAP